MSTKLITIKGNLGVDPVLKEIASGKKVCKFSLAENKEVIDENNVKQKKVLWHNVECWDTNAEYSAKELKKGAKVEITGSVKLSNWTDKEGNEKFSKSIVVKNISLKSFSKSNAPVAQI